MKLVLSFAALFAVSGAALAAQDYTLICNSSKLTAGDRHECRVQMTAAASQAEQAEIYRVYDAKIAGLSVQR